MEKPSLKSLLQFPSLPFSCEEAPLWQHSWGDIRIILPLPTCKCYAIKDRLHSACSKRRWVFSFLSTFKWKELHNWHFKNWWVRLRMACGEEWSYEWANGERRVKRTGCAVKEPKLTAFLSVWVEAADATNSSPNKDIHWLVLQDFFFFLNYSSLSFKVCRSITEVSKCSEMLWWIFVCLYNLIWMLYGVCFHVIDLICYVCTWCGWPLLKTLGDASDSVRTWSGVCPMVPGSSCLFLRCLKPMSNEGSSLIKFIWIYA